MKTAAKADLSRPLMSFREISAASLNFIDAIPIRTTLHFIFVFAYSDTRHDRKQQKKAKTENKLHSHKSNCAVVCCSSSHQARHF